MEYINAWLSLIGWNEAAYLAVIFVLLALADRFVLWHDKHSTWPGLIALMKRRT